MDSYHKNPAAALHQLPQNTELTIHDRNASYPMYLSALPTMQGADSINSPCDYLNRR